MDVAAVGSTNLATPHEAVREALRIVLDIDIPKSAEAVLAELGADSLALVSVADILESTYAAVRLRIDDGVLAEAHTVGDLAADVQRSLRQA